MSRAVGRFGESWAVGHLSRLGYDILERNVRFRTGEIDIVAEHEGDLVFVEVKCRRGAQYGSPESSITRTRFQHLAAAIAQYLDERGLSPPSYRVDVVAILVGTSGRVEECHIIRGVGAPE